MSSLHLLWLNNSKSSSCTVSLLTLLLQTSACAEKEEIRQDLQPSRSGRELSHTLPNTTVGGSTILRNNRETCAGGGGLELAVPRTYLVSRRRPHSGTTQDAADRWWPFARSVTKRSKDDRTARLCSFYLIRYFQKYHKYQQNGRNSSQPSINDPPGLPVHDSPELAS